MSVAAPKPEVSDILRVPPWALLLIGFSGGGGLGTIVSRPVWGGGDGLSREDVKSIVEEVVDAREKSLIQAIQASNETLIEKNNEATLGAVKLLLAEDKLDRLSR